MRRQCSGVNFKLPLSPKQFIWHIADFAALCCTLMGHFSGTRHENRVANKWLSIDTHAACYKVGHVVHSEVIYCRLKWLFEFLLSFLWSPSSLTILLWPSDIDKAASSATAVHWIFSLIFWKSLEMAVFENPSRSAACVVLWPATNHV